jgi:hypothetical protein
MYDVQKLGCTEDVKTGSNLALRIIEISGYGDDCVGHLSTKECLCKCRQGNSFIDDSNISTTDTDVPAVSFIFMSTKAPTWLGEYSLPWARTQASPFLARKISYDAVFLWQEAEFEHDCWNSSPAAGSNVHFLLDFSVLKTTTNKTLCGWERALRVGDGLTLGGLTDKALAILEESHNGWGCARSLSVLNDARLRALHDGNTGVGGTQVNTNDVTLDVIAERSRGWQSR